MKAKRGMILISLLAILMIGLTALLMLGVADRRPEGARDVCTQEAKLCPDGSTVGRTLPDCEFADCPGETAFIRTYLL